MTLYDLFHKVSFDEVVPYLLPLLGDHTSVLHNFRESFDLIRLYEPVKGFAEEVFLRHVDPEVRKGEMLVRFVDGDAWPHALAKEVVFEEDEKFADADIVANCLYEMTFYGFSEEEHTGEGDELGLFWKPEAPSEAKVDNLIDKLIQEDDKAKNRIKRLRKARWQRQLDQARSQAKKERLLLRMQQAFPLKEIGHLMWMSSGREYYYRSTIADGDERLPYIMESIQKYQRLGRVIEYEKGYCWMHVPMNFPWSDTVWQDFQQELMEYLGIPIRFGLVPKECSCDEIGGFLLLYKEE